jgi:predicted nuclease of predicted toxin-antitoxin system
MSSIPSPGERFLADEGVDFRIVAALRGLGYQVQSVAEDSPGIPDAEVFALAVDRDAVLITEDKDFGEMVFQKRLCSQGVLLLRLEGVPATRKLNLMTEAFTAHAANLRGCFSVITERALRIRPLEAD